MFGPFFPSAPYLQFDLQLNRPMFYVRQVLTSPGELDKLTEVDKQHLNRSVHTLATAL